VMLSSKNETHQHLIDAIKEMYEATKLLKAEKDAENPEAINESVNPAKETFDTYYSYLLNTTGNKYNALKTAKNYTQWNENK